MLKSQAHKSCHYLSVYERQGDSFIEEHKLIDFDPRNFSIEFGLDISDDPEMIFVYPLKEEHVRYLSRLLLNQVIFDFGCYEYFLEAYADKS
ncbi:DUF7683 domain-containing protein [Acaryochloris marina NIES-2412]|uniref:DUF7683 domain-containing protein n=1 Tax=Acaryochloris marina TaxID=155978 RepID=UPI004057E407